MLNLSYIIFTQNWQRKTLLKYIKIMDSRNKAWRSKIFYFLLSVIILLIQIRIETRFCGRNMNVLFKNCIMLRYNKVHNFLNDCDTFWKTVLFVRNRQMFMHCKNSEELWADYRLSLVNKILFLTCEQSVSNHNYS